ncbi:Ion transport protein-domain-containing protein [Choanephora cucurbitarum]|nr:Ion transport protein-domain-containing protein [Choanephora cucurbitarum]
MMAIIAYWLQLILSVTDTPWSPLSVLACCRLFRFLALTEGTQTLMISIYGSLDMLKNVMGFFVFFWVLFSLAALGLFPNAFTRQCAIVNETISWVEPRLACAGYWLDSERVGPLDWPSQTQLIYTGTDGYYCQLGQVCIQDTQNQPMHGHLSFQHMGYAMLNMFTIISTENWTDLLYIAQDSTSTWGTALFFASCIYVMTFILVPMFIAVITTSFSQGKQASPYETQEKLQDWVDQDAPSLYRSEWQVLCYRISHHSYFQYLMNGLTLLSVVPMAWYPMDSSAGEWAIQGLLQRLLDSLFCIEITIRAMGCLTLKQFWFDGRRNQFDSLIVLATVLDSLPLFNRFHLILIIFPILRFYRILYLFPGVHQLTVDVIGDGKGIRNLVCFTFLVLFILASISVQLFGGDFEFVKDEPAMLFDTFYQAFLSLFQIMTGENWVDILYDAMHSQEYKSVTFAAVFISLMYFIVHYLVLNLFVAVIMQNFDLEDEEIKRIQIKKYIERKQLKPEYFQWDQFTRLLVPLSLYLEKKLLKLAQLPQHLVARVNRHQFKQFYDVAVDYGSLDIPSWYAEDFSTGRSSPPASIISSGSSVISHRRTSVASVRSTHQPFHEPMRYVDDYDEQITKENNAVIMENLQLLGSLMLFKRDSQIYHLCVQWTKSTLYKIIIILLICLGSGLALWADEYHRVHDADQIAHVVEPIHRVLIVLYFGNIMVHGIANGLIILPDAYLRKLWNVLDVCNLIIQAILMIFGQDVASYLRVLRTLRILRIMYHIQTMRHIFLDLLYGLPKLVDVVLLNLLVFLSFAVYGCALFSGQFVSCNEDGLVKQACTFEFASDDTMGILVPRVWENPYDYSFDTFGASFLHLFECASGEGWIRSLFTAMSVQRDQPLEFDWSMRAITHSMYYVVFMFIASLCSIQLFIGVFLEIFKQRNGISQLTSKQRQFQDLQRQLALLKPSRRVFRPQHPIRAFFYDLVINKRGRFARWMAHLFSVGIAFRLAQRNESLDTLFKSIRRAIPSIASVSCVFSLVMLCFAVFFQEIFGLTRYGPYGNDHANFRSLFNSILTLFRITTGEDWDALMHDFFIRPSSCVNENDCGSPFYAIVLFSAFYIMCTYIFVNLFTMIVIDNFSFTFDKRNRFTLITRSDLRNFKIAWSHEDPYATGYISVDQVSRFLSQLEGVLSIRVYDEKHSIANLMAASKQFDINPTHLASISGPDQNKNKEHLFNFHQLNQQLATVDPKTIRLRKRRYAEVYKEVVNTATRKGVEFRTMLKILAMQLIDASSSLRFDALIHHSRMKQQIEQQLAFENAHGLINMMVARRRFLKWRQRKPHVSSEPHTRNSIAIVGQWLQPSVPNPPRQENSE